jgi:uncharacterized protein YjbJ (UPF0337 family)/ElaB/YqjD/DUF883 family membrane-anchored ribosome-binding protein
MNEQTLQGNWNEVKGGIRERWGQVSDDDLSSFNGNIEQLVGLIQRKTGEARERIEHYLGELTERTSSGMDRASAAAREYAEQMQQSYDEMAQRMRAGYADAEDVIRRNPAESVAVSFGVGLVAGVIVGLVMRR